MLTLIPTEGDDEELFEANESAEDVDVPASGLPAARAAARKRSDNATRRAIEDYLERKRMRELLDDDFYQLDD